MKRILYFIAIITLILSGCKKYEDGPLISFRSKVNRLTGKFEIDKFLVNNEDSTLLYNEYMGIYLEIDYFENLTNTYLGFSDNNKSLCSGHWDIQKPKTTITTDYYYWYIDTDSLNSSHKPPIAPFESYNEWTILKLTNKKLWLKTNYNNKEYILKYNKIENYNGQ